MKKVLVLPPSEQKEKKFCFLDLDAVFQISQEVLVRLLQDGEVLLLLHGLDPPVGDVL